MLKEIKWGFIGCGKVVQDKSGIAFNTVPDSSIFAIMRRNLEDAHTSANLFNAQYWFDNINDLLASGINAVYIATPPGLHYKQAMACCDAGKPVYIEKPFARNYTEAYSITEAFRKREVPLYVGHYRRALPRFIKIKQILDENQIGKVCSVDFKLNRIFSKQEALNIAAHTLDIIAFLFGDINEINGFAVNNGTECPLEDTVVLSFQTKKRIIGTACFNCISNEKSDRMIVKGTKGSLEFSIHGRHDIVVNNYVSNSIDIIEIKDPKVIEEPMIKSVVDDLLKRGDCPCTGEDALSTYLAIDKVLDNFYHGRNDDFWNYPERWKYE